MTYRSITIATLATAISFPIMAARAGAQAHPAQMPTRPIVAPGVARTAARTALARTSSSVMAAGPYKLDLHAQKKNNQNVNTPDFVAQTSVSRLGSAITITASDGMTLSGSVSGTQLHASGTTSGGGTLVLAGATSSAGAGGTFTVHDGSNTITGTFTLAPGLDVTPTAQVKIQNYGDPKHGTTQPPPCGFWCQMKKWFGL